MLSVSHCPYVHIALEGKREEDAAVQGSWAGSLVAGAALWTLYGGLLGCLGAAAKWSFTGKLEPHNGFSMYDSLSFRRALVLISEMPLGEPTFPESGELHDSATANNPAEWANRSASWLVIDVLCKAGSMTAAFLSPCPHGEDVNFSSAGLISTCAAYLQPQGRIYSAMPLCGA